MFRLLTFVLLIVCSESTMYWEPVFIGYQETGQSIYDAWTNTVPGSCNINTCGVCTVGNGCLPEGEVVAILPALNRHLKSKIIDCWNTDVKIKEVRVELLNKTTKEVLVYMEFNAVESTNLNWFSNDRLLRSSWDDMFSDGIFNYFSISGHIQRRFFINQNYGGCPNDFGWFSVLDANTHPCPWDNQPKYPVFLYAPGHHKTRWDIAYARADIFAVYIKRG